MISDDARLIVGSLHEELVFGNRMAAMADNLAGMFGVEVKDSFVSRGTTQNVQKEGGCIAMACGAVILKMWVKSNSKIGIICDGATIGDKHYQAVGFVRPVMDAEGNVLRFERVVIGCGAALFHDGKATFELTMQMLGDMVDAHNFILCGESVAGSKEKREDRRKQNGQSNSTRETIHANEEPVGRGAAFAYVKNHVTGGVDVGTLDFTTPLRLHDLVFGLCGTISDHGEHVIKNHLVPHFELLAREKIQRERAQKRIDFLVWMNKRFTVKDHMTGQDKTISIEWQKMWMREGFDQEDPDIVPYQELSNLIFYCDWHKICKNIEYSLNGIGSAEEDLNLAGALLGTNLSKRRDTGALITSIIHTMSKFLGRGKHDESLSKGKLFAQLRELEGEIQIKMARLNGSRGSSGYYECAWGCLQYMLDAGDFGLQQILVGTCRGKADKGKLNEALGKAGMSELVKDILRSMVFFQVLFWRPMITYVQNDRTTKHDTIRIWRDYKMVLDKLVAWAESRLPLSALPWLDDDEELDSSSCSNSNSNDFNLGDPVWLFKHATRGEDEEEEEEKQRTRGTISGTEPLTVRIACYEENLAPTQAEAEVAARAHVQAQEAARNTNDVVPDAVKHQRYNVTMQVYQVQHGDTVCHVDGSGQTALLTVAQSSRVLSREEERENTRISRWVGPVTKREESRRVRAEERVQEARKDRKSRREQQVNVVQDGNVERLRVLIRHQIAEAIGSHDRIHSAELYDGLILHAASDAQLPTPEQIRKAALLITSSRWMPSTSKLIEGFIGLFGYVREWSPNSTDQSSWNILAMREIGYTGLMVAIKKMDAKLYHSIMNAGRAFSIIYGERVDERTKKQKQKKHALFKRDLMSGALTAGNRDAVSEERQKLARGWTHVTLETLKLKVKSLFPDMHRAKAGRIKKQHQWVGRQLQMFKYVHGCHSVVDLKSVYYGKDMLGNRGKHDSLACGGTHRNANGSCTKYSLADHVEHLWRCSKYVNEHGSPTNYVSKMFEMGEQVLVQRDGRSFFGKVIFVIDRGNYRVAISDPTWNANSFEIKSSEGDYTIQTFTCERMQKVNQDPAGRNRRKRRRASDRNAAFNNASDKPGLDSKKKKKSRHRKK
jgi:hypothetical protein